MYRLKTYEEIETILKNWMDTGGPESSDSNGTYSAGGSETKSDALDDLVKEVSTSSDSEDKPKKSKKTSDEVSSKKQSLDEAFSDLMKD
jgi:gas vesicle protein